MYQPKYPVKKKHRKLQKRMMVSMQIVVILLTICLFVLARLNQVTEITIIGKWQSQETGQVLSFTSEGDVKFKSDITSGTYRIISPNTLEYTVEGKTFEMIYRIEENNLYWGINEAELEVFTRK